MNQSPHRTRVARAAAAVFIFVIVSVVSGARAAGSPGQPAFEAMMKAWQAGKIDEALEAADAVLKAEPSNVAYLNAIGGLYCEKAQKANVLMRLSWARKCHSTWERARAIDPSHVGVHTSLIRYYLQAPGIAGGGPDKAKAEASRMSALDPVSGEISFGHIARSQKQPAEAEQRYKKAAEMDRAGMRGPVELAAFYASERRWTDARAVFEVRLARNAGDAFAAYQLARLMQAQGTDLAKAVDLFDRYIAQPAPEGGPTHADAWFRKGQVLDALGRRDDAIAALETALRLAPKHGPAARELQKLKG